MATDVANPMALNDRVAEAMPGSCGLLLLDVTLRCLEGEEPAYSALPTGQRAVHTRRFLDHGETTETPWYA